MFENLEQLMQTIRERKNSSPDKSYTNKLLNDKNLSVAKIKEEIGELIDAVEFAKLVEINGAGEILLTSMDKDGTKSGYDVDLLKEITNTTNIPVIASGGVGTLDHLYDGIVKGGASAVLAASIFHYGEYKIKEAKEYLNSKNVSVRL